ncbi:MAG: hypothetical protein AAGN82_27680 [Myxococcota bacterium]
MTYAPNHRSWVAVGFLAATACAPPRPAPPAQRDTAPAASRLRPALEAMKANDTNRARQELSRLRSGDDPVLSHASRVLLRRIEAHEEAVSRTHRLALEVLDAKRRLEAIERALVDAQAARDVHEEASRTARDQVARLRGTLSERDEAIDRLKGQVQELERKLEALKKIDLDEE